MNVQTLLGDRSLASFVAEFYQRLPYSAAAGGQPFSALGTWESLASLLGAPEADVVVCRQNSLYPGRPPQTREAAEQLVNEGYTLLVRHAEKHDPRLADLAAAFTRDFVSEVNIHVYCTPGGQYGFGWHYDAEEVFIVQTTGCKEYQLRKNTVNPWPIEETLPRDMHYEREIMPLMRCALNAGDWLYIPSGYWHMATSRELSISLAVGVQPCTAVDVFDFLRPQILNSLVWRQRLPVVSPMADEAQLREQFECLFQQLGQDLAKMLANPQQVAAFLASRTTR